MQHNSDLHRMLDWLSHAPPIDSIARSMALDYLASYKPIQTGLWHLSQNGTCVCIGQYGGDESQVGLSYSSVEWRALKPVGGLVLTADKDNVMTWSLDKEFVVINLYARGVIIGFLSIRFAKALTAQANLKRDATNCSRAISLYLSLRYHEKFDSNPSTLNEEKEERQLSQRQLAILRGLSDEKTNRQISEELGYSVSTIRHETMRIYEILKVSDRLEAAVVGRRLSFI